MGVPPDRADEVLDFIVQGAESVGILREIKGKKYVDRMSSSRSGLAMALFGRRFILLVREGVKPVARCLRGS